MNAGEGANKSQGTGQSEAYYKAIEGGRPVIIVTKAAWYKELSGVVGFLAWTALVVTWAYALVSPGRTFMEEWWYLLALVAVGLTCAALREQSPRINTERG